MDKQQLQKSIHNHESAASLSMAIKDYGAAYQSYQAAVEEAKTLAEMELDKKKSDEYLALSDSFLLKARIAIQNGHFSASEVATLTPRKPVKGFKSFIGLEETKKYLTEELVNPWKEGKFHERDLHCLFVYGPEDNGKKTLVQSLSQELDATIYLIQPFEAFSVYNKDNAIFHMEHIFRKAEEKNNVVLYFPRPVAFFPKGNNDMNKMTANLFLSCLEKEVKKVQEENLNILFVAGTSAPDKLTENLFRKGLFDDLVKVHHPNHKTRHDIIKDRTQGFDISEEMIENMVMASRGFIAKDVSRMVRQAKKFATFYQGESPLPIIDQVILDKVMSDFTPDDNDREFKHTVVDFEESVKNKVHIFDNRI